jgi:hypothetical protein
MSNVEGAEAFKQRVTDLSARLSEKIDLKGQALGLVRAFQAIGTESASYASQKIDEKLHDGSIDVEGVKTQVQERAAAKLAEKLTDPSAVELSDTRRGSLTELASVVNTVAGSGCLGVDVDMQSLVREAAKELFPDNGSAVVAAVESAIANQQQQNSGGSGGVNTATPPPPGVSHATAHPPITPQGAPSLFTSTAAAETVATINSAAAGSTTTHHCLCCYL